MSLSNEQIVEAVAAKSLMEVMDLVKAIEEKFGVSAAAPVAATPTDYISAAVDSHNYHRANHSASDMSWSDSLAASALIVANTCVFQHDMYVYPHPSS